MPRDIVDIIKDFVKLLDFQFEIKSLLYKLENIEVKDRITEENKTASTENGEEWRNNKPLKPPPKN